VAEFNRKKETEAFVRCICARIRNPKIRRAVEAEYTDHIDDAVYHAMLGGMEEKEAFEQAIRSLGAPDNYRDLLADIHTEEEIPPALKKERRVWLITCAASVILFLIAAAGATALWGIFVPQIIAVFLAAWLLLWLWRYSIALVKRIRALHKMNKTAKENGFAAHWNHTVFTSMFIPAAVPSVMLENEKSVYKIRFVAALKKNQILRFVGQNMYIPVSVRGGMMLNHRHPFIFGSFGNPPPVRIFYSTHSDFAEYASAVRVLPTLERRFDDKSKAVREVLIFNPAPMQVLYRQNTVDTPILGGETVDGVQLHDTVSFCSMIGRGE